MNLLFAIFLFNAASALAINPSMPVINIDTGAQRAALPNVYKIDGATIVNYRNATYRHESDGWRQAVITTSEFVSTNTIPLDAQLLMSEYAAALNEVFATTNAHLIYDRDQVALAVGTSTNLSLGDKLDFLSMEDQLREAFGAADLRLLPYGKSEIVTTNTVQRWEVAE